MSGELDAFIEYISVIKRLSPRTIEAYTRDLVEIEEKIGKNLVSMESHEIFRLLGQIANKRTLNRKLSAFNSFLDFCHRHHYDSVSSKFSLSKIPKNLPKYLPYETIEAGLRRIDRSEWIGLRDYALILFLYATGMRIGESLAAEERDIEGEWIRIRHGKAKQNPPVRYLILAQIAVYQNIATHQPPGKNRFIQPGEQLGRNHPGGQIEGFFRCLDIAQGGLQLHERWLGFIRWQLQRKLGGSAHVIGIQMQRAALQQKAVIVLGKAQTAVDMPEHQHITKQIGIIQFQIIIIQAKHELAIMSPQFEIQIAETGILFPGAGIELFDAGCQPQIRQQIVLVLHEQGQPLQLAGRAQCFQGVIQLALFRLGRQKIIQPGRDFRVVQRHAILHAAVTVGRRGDAQHAGLPVETRGHHLEVFDACLDRKSTRLNSSHT